MSREEVSLVFAVLMLGMGIGTLFGYYMGSPSQRRHIRAAKWWGWGLLVYVPTIFVIDWVVGHK